MELTPLDDASLPTDEQGLHSALSEISARLEKCDMEIRRLMAEEDPAAGIFLAAEIHGAKQLRMMLHYQHELCKTRLARLNMA